MMMDRPVKSPDYCQIIPKVYTFGMSKYAVINLKTDPELKARAAATADRLGVSLSAILNNELRRFAVEQSVTFDIPEVPNARTAAELAASRKQIEAGDYRAFDANDEALDFLANELK
jgi:antitoxin component of RelBE/YafQ-DinJ toxin-antitoxin module